MRIRYNEDINDFEIDFEDDPQTLARVFLTVHNSIVLDVRDRVVAAIRDVTTRENRMLVAAAVLQLAVWLYDPNGLERTLFNKQMAQVLAKIPTRRDGEK